jgi:hypothetical protein
VRPTACHRGSFDQKGSCRPDRPPPVANPFGCAGRGSNSCCPGRATGSFERKWIYANGPSLVPKAQPAPSRDARGGGSAGPKPRYDWPMCWSLSGFRRGTAGRADERGRSGRTRSRTVPGHRPSGRRAARTPCAVPPGRCAVLGGDGPARPGQQPQGHRRASPRGPFSLPAGPRHRSEIRRYGMTYGHAERDLGPHHPPARSRSQAAGSTTTMSRDKYARRRQAARRSCHSGRSLKRSFDVEWPIITADLARP